MPATTAEPDVPPAFAAAVASVRAAASRPELVLSEIAAPGTLAPWSIALAADVTPARHGDDSDLGTGRFVLLYDPSAPDAWGGPFRVICYAQAPLETEIGIDPFLADVAWSWLVDALAQRGADYTAASGTATKVLSTGFGELQAQGDGAQIELRASWTPTGHDLGADGSVMHDLGADGSVMPDLGAHVSGWGDLLCMLAGLPPAAEGVSLLSARRVGRD